MLKLPFRDKIRVRTPEERFARRPSPVAVVLIGGVLAAFAILLVSGADNESTHKILTTKSIKRTMAN